MRLIDEKSVGSMGRIVIPDSLRDECHMEEGDTVAIFKTDNGDVLLRSRDRPKEVKAEIGEVKCSTCGEVDQGIRYDSGRSICVRCAEELLEKEMEERI